jgi:hypothetical protein
MKNSLLVLLVAAASAVPMLAEKPVEIKETGKDRFEAAFPSGGQLRLRVRSGDVEVTGGAEDKIVITYGGTKADQGREVTVTLKRLENNGELRVSGGPKNEFQIRIQMPRSCNLFLRMPAGELNVAGISGDKDIELHAGDATVKIGSAADYGAVDASVTTGELDAPPFEVSKGGMFRSFKKQGSGKYRLHAHVGAGQLTLE